MCIYNIYAYMLYDSCIISFTSKRRNFVNADTNIENTRGSNFQNSQTRNYNKILIIFQVKPIRISQRRLNSFSPRFSLFSLFSAFYYYYSSFFRNCTLFLRSTIITINRNDVADMSITDDPSKIITLTTSSSSLSSLIVRSTANTIGYSSSTSQCFSEFKMAEFFKNKSARNIFVSRSVGR